MSRSSKPSTSRHDAGSKSSDTIGSHSTAEAARDRIALGPAAVRSIRSVNVTVRRDLLRGLPRLEATTTVLQRARQADPMAGMWEAADVQWWWRRPRVTDDLA